MSLIIEYEYGPGGNCPVQAEGKINGLPFYFRSRGGHWSLSIAKTPNGDTLDYEKCYFHREEYDGVNKQEAEEFQGQMLRFDAGWAEPEECRAFIERTAERLLQPNVQSEPRGGQTL